VVGSEPATHVNQWSLKLFFAPDASLEIEAGAAEFYVGNVPGCDAAQPDFSEADDESIRAGLAQWESEFEVVHAVFLDSR
jgi:hypothetical protein